MSPRAKQLLHRASELTGLTDADAQRRVVMAVTGALAEQLHKPDRAWLALVLPITKKLEEPRAMSRHRWMIAWIVGLIGCATAGPRPEATAEPERAATAPSQTHAQSGAPQHARHAEPDNAAATAIVPIPNAQEPLPGVVTGGVPTQANLRDAEALGYRTVISLLAPAQAGDEPALVAQLGMRFVSIPISGPPDLTRENAERLGEVIHTPRSRPLILHCGSGNRAGALLALEAFYVEHLSEEAALELGAKAGMTSLRPAVEAELDRASAAPGAR